MTVTAFEASPVQSQPDALDPSHLPIAGTGQSGVEVLDPINLPITGTGRKDGLTIAYTNTDATGARFPIQQPNKFDQVVAGEFPGEGPGQISYVTRVDRVASPRPAWHDFIETDGVVPAATETPTRATPSHSHRYAPRHKRVETTTAATEAQAEAPRERLFTRVRRHVANLAMRLTRHTDGVEAAAREGVAQPTYVGRHMRNTKVEARMVAMAENRESKGLDVILSDPQPLFEEAPAPVSEPFVGVAKVTSPNTTPTAFTGRANVAEAMAALQTVTGPAVAAAPEAVQIAPTPVEPATPKVQAPGTHLELHPTASREAVAFNSTAGEAFLQGLKEAGYPSLDAFKEVARNANTEERSNLYKVLAGIVRSKSRVWHSDVSSDHEGTKKLQDLSDLVGKLNKDLSLRPPQESPDEKAARLLHEQKRTATATLASMAAARRLLR